MRRGSIKGRYLWNVARWSCHIYCKATYPAKIGFHYALTAQNVSDIILSGNLINSVFCCRRQQLRGNPVKSRSGPATVIREFTVMQQGSH